ncbi:zinc protease [Spirochaetia bacterium]|nr:zinc protease [Spirochaetia bacterium]
MKVKTNSNARFKLIAALLILLCILCTCKSTAKNVAEKSQQSVSRTSNSEAIPFMDGVLRGKLKSGLTYYLYENKKPENRAFLTLAVNAGSVLETEDQRGLAHILEHMAFNGTERFPESALVEYLRSLGMRFGADLNAYTSYDETVYRLEVPTENINGVRTVPQKSIDILADWTNAININDSDLDDERNVVMEEYRLRLGASERMRRFLFPRLFEGSMYAQRQPIGLPEVIQNAPTALVKDFYKKWYVPNNMAIIICGDFDSQNLLKQLQKSFDSKYFEVIPSQHALPDSKNKNNKNNKKSAAKQASFIEKQNAATKEFKRNEYYLSDPVRGKRQVEIFSDPELTRTNISLFYKHKWTAPTNDMNLFRREMVDTIIDIIMSERFDEEAQKADTPFINAGSGWTRYVRNSVHWSLSATAKQGLSREAITSILQIKEYALRYGFTDSEIDRAKKTITAYLERAYSEREKQNSDTYVELFTNNFLQDQYASSAQWDLENGKKILPLITNKNLLERYKSYFSFDDIFVFIYGPENEKETIPLAAEIKEILTATTNMTINKKDEGQLSEELLDLVPEPGDIIKESYDTQGEFTNWSLSNGAQVIVKETNIQNDQIVLYATAKGGHASVNKTDNISERLASEMLNASGMGNFNLTDLRKKLSGKQVSFSFNIGPFTRNIQGASNNSDLKTMFEMLYLNFTRPRIEDSAVAVMVDKYKTRLINRKLDPSAVFSDELTKQIYNSHAYFMPLEIADLEKIDTKAALEFVKQCNNPSDWLFVFSGNINSETLKPFVKTYIASLEKQKEFNDWTYIDFKHDSDFLKNGKKETVQKGKEEKVTYFASRTVPRKWNEQDNLVTSVLSEYLDIVMVQEIREKLGGVYTISASTASSLFPPQILGNEKSDGELSLELYFGCDPKRVDELSNAIEHQLKRIADGDIDSETFEKSRLACIKSFEKSLQSNLYISTVFANRKQLFNVPIAEIYKRPDQYKALTTSSMQNIMKLLLAKKPLVVVMIPE